MSKLLQAAAAAVNGNVSTETPAANTSFYWIDESKIIDNPFQYRMLYDPDKMLELAENIRLLKNDLPTLGLEQVPFARIVRLVSGDYVPVAREEIATPEQIAHCLRQDGVLVELMFGHRRRRAWTIIRYGMLDGCNRLKLDLSDEQRTRYFALAGDADYSLMPLHIGYADDQQMWKHAVSENRQRSDVTAIEEAEAMFTAKKALGYSDGQVGEVFGYARSTVANKLRLLDLPAEIKDKMVAGEISERAGRTVLALKDDPERLQKALVQSSGSIDQLEFQVRVQTQSIEQEKRRLRQAEALRSQGIRVIEEGEQYEDFSNWGNISTELLKKGICGKEQCTCFVACYSTRQYSGQQKIDEQIAPDFVAACADPKTAREKSSELLKEKRTNEEQKAQAVQAKAEREKEELTRRWHEETQNLRNAAGSRRLTSRPEFWRFVIDTLRYEWQTTRNQQWQSMDELESAIFDGLLVTAKEYKGMTPTLNAKKIDELLNRLAGVIAS
jgi:ParB-like chromosome segregation protein Spo0J